MIENSYVRYKALIEGGKSFNQTINLQLLNVIHLARGLTLLHSFLK